MTLLRILLVLLLIAAIGVGVIFLLGKPVEVKPAQAIAAIGDATDVHFVVTGKHGAKQFSAEVEQNGKRQVVFEDKQKSPQTTRVYSFTVGRKQASFLAEGPAKLIVTAKANDTWGAMAHATVDVTVVLRPPLVSADGLQHYINQGGAELVMIEAAGNWTEAGVHVGPNTARSFPMPGQKEDSPQRFSLFPFSYDLPPDTMPVVFARNAAGTEATATFWVKLFPKTFHSSTIELTDENMRKVLADVEPNGSGDLVTRFVHFNRDVRKQNNQTLADLRLKSAHKILWSGPFEAILGKRESYFADHRTYTYNGKTVDEQVHLGFDIAAHEHMPVKAENSGIVVWAKRLGIYGNAVVLDHGYGLQTLYGHMSRIDVKEGDAITKLQPLGLSGSTGLAFGDHVHLSMLVEGVQVNPIEWWDEHWIHDRILSKIGPGAGTGGASQERHAANATKAGPRIAGKHRKRAN
jgi:murein DD-endopeptidase MepM/ murein hydrolase activator NlpD